MPRIILAAGGTGGHFFPAVALYNELIKKGYDPKIITDQKCAKYLEGIKNFRVISIRSPGSSIVSKIACILQIFWNSIKIILTEYILHRPSVVVGFGAYPSLPALIAAKMLFIPIILHEQNALIGSVNLFFFKYATKVALSFKNTVNIPSKHKVVFTGNPTRSIEDIDSKKTKESSKFKICVFGGSQSASIFDDLLPKSIANVYKFCNNPYFQEIHITQQTRNKAIVSSAYNIMKVENEVSEFFFNMHKRIAESDLVISRAGGSTIAEIITAKTPAILIPLPNSRHDHQYVNAKQLGDGVICIRQDRATPSIISSKILHLMKNPETLKKMETALSSKNKSAAVELLLTVVTQNLR
jgi:UDP-N-acetylglucosamine--N-acetylmuramyl-(pentapeptide) pyrophosphoryl-undecaprenol N-acetylglucosamine transferase